MTQRRRFLSAAAIAAVAAPSVSNAQYGPKSARGPILLTVSGLIGKGNRGPLEPALDHMMAKQLIKFDRAQVFDFAALTAMPAVTIRPTLEFDGKVHTMKGPLLADVMAACGVKMSDATAFFVRAVDGYASQITGAEVRKYKPILATHLDGQPMALGGVGPLWTIYDVDRFPEMMAKELHQRYPWCPWSTYHIEVRAG